MEVNDLNLFFAPILEKSEKEIQKIQLQSHEKINSINTAKLAKINAISLAIKKQQEYISLSLEDSLENGLGLQKKRITLLQEKLFSQAVIDQIYIIMKKRIQEPGYSQILTNWICDGILSVVGPNDKSVSIKTSKEELPFFQEDLFNMIRNRIFRITSKQSLISFIIDKNNLLNEQGVIIVSEDKRIIFSNTLSSQIARINTKIHLDVYKHIIQI